LQNKAPKRRDKYANDAVAWQRNAGVFREATHLLFNHGNPLLYFPAAILGHQTLEMFLKAALIKKGFQISPIQGDVWGHDLPQLVGQLFMDGPPPPALLEVAKTFNDYFNELRYPRELNKVEGLGEIEGWQLEDVIKDFLLPSSYAANNEI